VLTGKSPPAGDVAGSAVRQDGAGGRQAGGHDGVREGDGGGELDQGDVVTGIDNNMNCMCHELPHTWSGFNSTWEFVFCSARKQKCFRTLLKSLPSSWGVVRLLNISRDLTSINCTGCYVNSVSYLAEAFKGLDLINAYFPLHKSSRSS